MRIINGITYPTVSEYCIAGFYQEYGWLSNAAHSPIKFEDIFYRTAEQVFMARKTLVLEERQNLAVLESYEAIKAFGQTVSLRPNWNIIRIQEMRHTVTAKFTQNPGFKEMFIGLSRANDPCKHLRNDVLVDSFWGQTSNGMGWLGDNHLGRVLMDVNDDLRGLYTPWRQRRVYLHDRERVWTMDEAYVSNSINNIRDQGLILTREDRVLEHGDRVYNGDVIEINKAPTSLRGLNLKLTELTWKQ